MIFAPHNLGRFSWRAIAAVLSAVLLLTGSTALHAATFDVTTLGGEKTTGELRLLDSRHLVVVTRDGTRDFPLEQVVALTAVDPVQRTAGETHVTLADGSTLTGLDYSSDGKVGKLHVSDAKSIDLPLSAIAVVRFHWHSSSADAGWKEVKEPPTATDLLVVRQKDATDIIEGAIGTVGDQRVQFTVDGETIAVKREKIEGLLYARRGEIGPTGTKLKAARNFNLEAKSLTFDGGELVATTAAGAKIAVPLDELERLDFSADKVTYLSGLKPERVDWKPYFDVFASSPTLSNFFQPRTESTSAKAELLIGGKRYTKGISLVGQTTLIYRLPADVRQFRATVGVADRSAPETARMTRSARLVIKADNKVVFEQVIDGNQPSREVDVDVAGAKRLTLAVDYGQQIDQGTELVLAEARIMK